MEADEQNGNDIYAFRIIVHQFCSLRIRGNLIFFSLIITFSSLISENE